MVQRGCGSCSDVGHVSGFHATPRSMAYHRLDQRGVPLFSVSAGVHMHASRLPNTRHDNWEAVCVCICIFTHVKCMHCYFCLSCKLLYCMLWLQDVMQPCYESMTFTAAFPLLQLQFQRHTRKHLSSFFLKSCAVCTFNAQT